MPPRVTPCPQCGKDGAGPAAARFRPFCSKRCQLIDLGEWFEEKHRIPESHQDAKPFLGPGPEHTED